MIRSSRMNLTICLLFAILVGGLLSGGALEAQTVIPGGYVSGTWSAEGSPYLIDGTITVHNDSTLTIQAGVEVIFQANYQFIVEGKILAVGTESDSIHFTAASSLEGWGGIRLISAHVNSRVEYCLFELGWAQGAWPNNCGGAIYMYQTIQSIKNCSFINNRADYDGGAVFLWGGSPQFSYNLFTDNLAGNGHGHAIYMGNTLGLILNHLTLTGNGSGSGKSLYVTSGTGLMMKNSILMDSFSSFSYNSGDVSYNDLLIYVAELDSATAISDSLLALGEFNFKRDPRFMNAANGNLRLKLDSPCIDAASPTSPYSNEPLPNGYRANLGAYGNSSKAASSLPLLSFNQDTLRLQSNPINFGLWKINTTGAVNLTIYNAGATVLELEGLNISNSQFSSNFSELADTLTGLVLVYPDSSRVFSITFTPEVIDSISGTLTFDDNDTTSNPSVALTGVGVNPYIVIEPTTFNFDSIFGGATAVSETRRVPITISNTGPSVQGNLVISTITATDNFMVVTSGENRVFNQIIPAGGMVVDTVLFFPQAQTLVPFSDSLEVQNNAGDAYIYVSGSGAQPILAHDPDSLEYGVVAIGESKTDTFWVKNTGAVDLILSDFELTDAVNFSFIYDTTQSHIATDDSLEIPVVFHPTVSGPQQDTLRITTNVPTGQDNNGNWLFQEFSTYLLGTGTSQTNWVIGNVSGDWKVTDSPDSTYYAVGDITLPANSSLTIESGVKVKFEGNFRFTVFGTLVAEGDAAHAILFSPISMSGTWRGISFNTGSSGSTLHNCDLFLGSDSLGGALRISNASPTIDQCNFYDNTGERGGAVALLGWSNGTISQCSFYDNSATYGGALFADWFSQPNVINCEFYNNSADSSGGALYLSGAAGTVNHCDIHDNTASKRGGGVSLSDGAVTEFFENDIYDNSAVNGGGVSIRWFTQPFIHDERIYGNDATGSGGGVFIQNGSVPVMLKTLIADNTATQARALYSESSGPLLNQCTLVSAEDGINGWLLISTNGDGAMISNSIVWGTSWTDSSFIPVWTDGSSMVISYSDVLNAELYPGLNNALVDPEFKITGGVSEYYGLSSGSPCNDLSETGGKIGFEGGSSTLAWDITLNMVQNPVQLNSMVFVLTSTVPLLSPPYAYITQDLPDTVAYSPIDSSFMNQIAPMIYNLPLQQAQIDYPSIATFTLSNILGEDTTLVQSFLAADLYPSISSISLGQDITVNARSVSGSGLWGIMPENYAEPKPLDPELVAIGQAYQIFSSVEELKDGKIEFTLNEEILNGHNAEKCAVAAWSNGVWEALPSYLSGDRSILWADLEETGTYRLIWGNEVRTIMLPSQVMLAQNYPNPFNPETVIEFALPDPGQVKLEVYDLLGRRVITLLDAYSKAGYHRVRWAGANSYGTPVASGVYFYRLQSEGHIFHKKMILLR